MLSLKEKHESLSVASFKEKIEATMQAIDTDTSGAFWHKKQIKQYVDKTSLPDFSQPLAGLTVGVKDLFCIEGLTTTAGSRILADFVSPYTSTVWNTLYAKGATLVGKTAMDEFAMGSFTNTSYLGKTSIPGFPQHTAGGSSGGSAAAVASGIVDFAVGSDTGGSVRQPASFCGVVGYKPTYGAFSRFGMIAYASSLDQAGFFTKTIEDMHYLLGSDIALKDPKDMTCSGLQVSKEKQIKKVGYFPEMLSSSALSSDVACAYQSMIDDLKHAGVEVVPVSIPMMEYGAQIYYIIACSEASSNLARYQGVYYGQKLIDEPVGESFWDSAAMYRSKYFGEEAQKRIMLGSFILSAENFTAMYQKACKMRIKLRSEFDAVLSQVDTIVLPCFPTVAPKWDEISAMTSAQIYMADAMTVPISLAGLPACSLPWYKDSQGLGIGMQYVGKRFDDIAFIGSLVKLQKLLEK